MKKLTILTALCIFCALPVLSAETPAMQTTNDNRAVISVQKQPAGAEQKQEAKQNKWCIIIQINGKMKEVKNEVAHQ